MESKKLNFKQTLILLFLFKSNMQYELWELMQLLSLNIDKVVELLNNLSENGYIRKHKDIKQYYVTDKGAVYIFENFLTNINLENISEFKRDSYEEIIDRSRLLYIPKNFKNKID
jgi:predicted transcriptional regulator